MIRHSPRSSWNTAKVGVNHQLINRLDVKFMVMTSFRNHVILHGKMLGVE